MLKGIAFKVIDFLPQLFYWKKQNLAAKSTEPLKKQYLMMLAYILNTLFSTRVKVTAERSQRWFYTVNKRWHCFAKKIKYP